MHPEQPGVGSATGREWGETCPPVRWGFGADLQENPHSPTKVWHWGWVELQTQAGTAGVNSMSLTGCRMWTHPWYIKGLILCLDVPLILKQIWMPVLTVLTVKTCKCNEWSIFLIKMFVCSFSVISKHEAQYVNNVIYFDLFNFCIKKGKKKTFDSNILTFFYTGFWYWWTWKIM